MFTVFSIGDMAVNKTKRLELTFCWWKWVPLWKSCGGWCSDLQSLCQARVCISSVLPSWMLLPLDPFFLCVSTLAPSLRGLIWAPRLNCLLLLCANHLLLIFIIMLPNCLFCWSYLLLDWHPCWLVHVQLLGYSTSGIQVLWDRPLMTSATMSFTTARLALCTLATLKWISFPQINC